MRAGWWSGHYICNVVNCSLSANWILNSDLYKQFMKQKSKFLTDHKCIFNFLYMFQFKVNKCNLFAKQIRIKWIIFGLSVNKKKFTSFICAKLFCFLSAHQHISTEKHLHTIFFRETVLIFPWIHTPKSPPQQYLIRFDRIIFTKNSYKEKMNHKVSISVVATYLFTWIECRDQCHKGSAISPRSSKIVNMNSKFGRNHFFAPL